jgi:hypothetical protein
MQRFEDPAVVRERLHEAVASLWARRELDTTDVSRPPNVGGVEFTAQIGNSLQCPNKTQCR